MNRPWFDQKVLRIIDRTVAVSVVGYLLLHLLPMENLGGFIKMSRDTRGVLAEKSIVAANIAYVGIGITMIAVLLGVFQGKRAGFVALAFLAFVGCAFKIALWPQASDLFFISTMVYCLIRIVASPIKRFLERECGRLPSQIATDGDPEPMILGDGWKRE